MNPFSAPTGEGFREEAGLPVVKGRLRGEVAGVSWSGEGEGVTWTTGGPQSDNDFTRGGIKGPCEKAWGGPQEGDLSPISGFLTARERQRSVCGTKPGTFARKQQTPLTHVK